MARVRLRDLDPAEFLNAVNIGGATTVGGRLDVNHDTVKLYNSENTTNTFFFAENTSTGNAGIKMKNSQGEWTVIANDRLRFVSDDSPALEVLSLLPDGKVGIGGVIAPTEMLTINSASNTRILLQEAGSSKGSIGAGGSGLYIRNLAGRINFRNTSDADTVLIEDTGYVSMAAASQIRLTLGSEGTAGTNDANWIRGNGTQLEYNSASSNHNWEVGGSAKMRLDSTGRLGIGTGSSTLSHPLEVWHGTPEINLKDTSSSGQFRLTLDGVQAAIKNFSTNGALELLTTGTGNIVLSPAGDVKIDGKVGIFDKDFTGTTTPSSILHVKTSKGTESTIRLTQDNWRTWTVGMPADTSVFSIADSGTTRVFNIHHAALADTMWLGADGVAIGADVTGIGANVAKLNVNGGGLFNASVCLRYGLTNSNYALLSTNGQTLTIANASTGTGAADGHIVLSPTKNVGINESSPTHKLHVNGSLYADTISVGTGFVDMAVAGKMTILKSDVGGVTASTDAILSLEDSTPLVEILCSTSGKIMFAEGETKEVAGLEFHSTNQLKLHSGGSAVVTFKNQSGVPGRFHMLGAGTLVTDSNGNFTASSSRDLKTDIQDYNSGLSNILSLQPVKFKWRQDSGLDYKNHYVGFIAEDAQEALPESVVHPSKIAGEKEDEEIDNPNPKSLSDRAIIAALVNSIKELNTRIEQLENN